MLWLPTSLNQGHNQVYKVLEFGHLYSVGISLPKDNQHHQQHEDHSCIFFIDSGGYGTAWCQTG